MASPENIIVNKAPVQRIDSPFVTDAGISLFIKREDLIHPFISGNKWYKLKYNIIEAQKQGHNTILTFGGAYSNHIYAAASAGKLFGLNTIGIIRGEEHLPLNPTLKYATECGMKLYYLNREDYRRKNDMDIQEKLKNIFGTFYLIPEGGSNYQGTKGSAEIIGEQEASFNYICTPCGTGGTLAGIVASLHGNNKALGFSVLKDGGFLEIIVKKLVKEYTGKDYTNWEIIHDYHFGGYAKFTMELWDFIKNFKKETDIQLEPVYTGKMMIGIYDMISKAYFKKGESILVIHTGGLQGLAGFIEKYKSIINV